jgi:hypothetical protein
MILVVAIGVLCAQTAFAANQLRVSQVYGGGGGGPTTPATYNQDDVEIYNSGGTAVDISNWTIEYGSATGNWGSSAGNLFTFPQGTSIPGCKYILVALGTVSTNPAVPAVPSPDFSNTSTNMSGTSGKIGLFNALNANVACGSETAGTLVDKVAYGTSNCPEVTAAGILSTTTAAVRNGAGGTDTDNNANDFTVVTNATPRNSASPGGPGCTPIAVAPTTWSAAKVLFN